MPSCSYFSNLQYKFGFNTQNRSTEINVHGNSYSALYWEYDSRVVKRWNLDPKPQLDESPYIINHDNPIKNNDPFGDCPNCRIQGSFQLRATFTLGGKKGTSGMNIAIGAGGSARNSFGQIGVNASLNIYNSGLGLPGGKTGATKTDLAISPSLTFGTGNSQVAASLNTFQSSALSGVTNTFKHSLTVGQNFVFSNGNPYQRVGSYGLKSGDFSMNIYNDTKKFLGDGGDRWWTGGGNATITNFLGNKNNSLSFGNDVFTGNSIPFMSKSADDDAKMPTYSYGKNDSKALHYAGQSSFDSPNQQGFNQSLNMGQSFLRLNNAGSIYQISHSGRFDMFSQNMIHDAMDFHRFLSTVPNQFNFTSGSTTSTQ